MPETTGDKEMRESILKKPQKTIQDLRYLAFSSLINARSELRALEAAIELDTADYDVACKQITQIIADLDSERL